MTSLDLQGVLVVGSAAVAIGFAGIGFARRSRTFLVVATALGAALFAATQRIPGALPEPLPSVIAWGIIAIAVGVVYVALEQQPRRLARRLGFVRSSPEHEFDTALTDVVDRFNAVLDRARETRPSGSAREQLRSQAAAETMALRALHPPDDSWAEVAQAIAEAMDVHLGAWGEPLSDEQRTRVVELANRADARRLALRAAYRSRDASQFRWS